MIGFVTVRLASCKATSRHRTVTGCVFLNNTIMFNSNGPNYFLRLPVKRPEHVLIGFVSSLFFFSLHCFGRRLPDFSRVCLIKFVLPILPKELYLLELLITMSDFDSILIFAKRNQLVLGGRQESGCDVEIKARFVYTTRSILKWILIPAGKCGGKLNEFLKKYGHFYARRGTFIPKKFRKGKPMEGNNFYCSLSVLRRFKRSRWS